MLCSDLLVARIYNEDRFRSLLLVTLMRLYFWDTLESLGIVTNGHFFLSLIDSHSRDIFRQAGKLILALTFVTN